MMPICMKITLLPCDLFLAFHAITLELRNSNSKKVSLADVCRRGCGYRYLQ